MQFVVVVKLVLHLVQLRCECVDFLFEGLLQLVHELHVFVVILIREFALTNEAVLVLVVFDNLNEVTLVFGHELPRALKSFFCRFQFEFDGSEDSVTFCQVALDFIDDLHTVGSVP